jgi:large subunit ribosomal protein L25
MNDTTVIKAQSRNNKGKNAAFRLRDQGLIPAVLYGHNFPPVTLTISAAEISTILKPVGHSAGEHALHKLSIEDRSDIPAKDIMIKEIQRDPITHKILHIDLYAVRMDEKIIVPVRVNVTGKAPGVKMGGILQQMLREIKIKCFPSDIPQAFDVDVSGLEIGQSLHISDINISAHLEIHEDLSAPVVGVIAPTVVKEEVPVAEEGVPTPAPEVEKKPGEEIKSGEKKKSA